jgi:hypothetical protein
MKLRLLATLDRVIHAVLPGWVPFPLWAYRVCLAYDRAAFPEDYHS